jgi:PEP-CTERM motif-containing protein
MKFRVNLLFIVAVVAIMAASTRPASGQPLIFFDENGHSGGSFGSLPSGFGPDPLATGGPTFPTATLFYVLPFPVATGDLQLTEPPTGISDLVRFEGNHVFFYSDLNDPHPDLADVGLPLLLTATPTVIAETGTDGSNMALWIPPPGAPGAGGPGPIQYNIISDVPEPTSLWLVGLGGTLLLFVLRRPR